MVVSKLIKMQPDGGARENRTLDLILARDALSQLSYDPLWWAALDSNQECHKATDLQSAALPILLTDPYTSFKTHRVFQFTYWTYRNSHGINSNPNFPFQIRKLYSSYRCFAVIRLFYLTYIL